MWIVEHSGEDLRDLFQFYTTVKKKKIEYFEINKKTMKKPSIKIWWFCDSIKYTQD